ncbi:MAG: hypothetical protein AB2805_04945 [Candidatus Thiodiazotropha sp.]
MDNIIKIKIIEILDAIEKRRTSRLSRGSVRAQNGKTLTDRAWKKLQDSHPSRLERVSSAFYPEKYAPNK